MCELHLRNQNSQNFKQKMYLTQNILRFMTNTVRIVCSLQKCFTSYQLIKCYIKWLLYLVNQNIEIVLNFEKINDFLFVFFGSY
jgi:hypothetical protein